MCCCFNNVRILYSIVSQQKLTAFNDNDNAEYYATHHIYG